ncbi:formylglycine-generating enzyme family protein [Fuerstiella marisgermanici]|uniref:Gliding motility-associated lipoprotein n=1 Tax=Fuerstiella marisgermanici TaxID=1891926 RepID=A0A1P8WRX5_9PLAN|nr:SUMF1/EgtB/PvdO family nonheme iron enzyme [Fuerstiella marisgermanici]APZ96788.1 gliding motility-associated lipoprotein [Fuerstiella marisgermanici]
MTYILRLAAFTLIVSTNALAVAQPATDKDRPTAVPSESVDEMLKRFVDECVAIAPGSDRFPREFEVGEATPGKLELARQKATLKHDFRISKYETTQELYQAIQKSNPSRWQGPRNSVENVTWNDAQTFCNKLTQQLRAKKLIIATEVVRLPTAVEWEYCCRAGSKSRYCFGDTVAAGDSPTGTLDEYAWHTGNAAGNDPAVGVLKPNAWGLCDVHGYLWEFVSTPDDTKTQRQIRGGSWKDHHSLLTCSTFKPIAGDDKDDAIGFRCVIAVAAK